MPTLFTADRATVAEAEAELRKQMGHSFDLCDHEMRQTLISTFVREQGATAPASVDERTVPRQRAYVPPPPALPPTEWTEDQCRKALRAAIRDLNLREKAVQDAGTVADSAVRREAECRRELATYSDLDQRVTAWQVQALKQGRDVDDLPYGLKSALRSRDLATDRLDRATRARDVTESELKAAEADLVRAKSAVLRHASGVAVAIARQYSTRLEELERDAHTLRVKLASLQLMGQNVPDDLVRHAFAPLKTVQRNRDMTTVWTAFIRDLQSNPATELDLDGTEP